MATQAFRDWVAAGRPWKLAQPVLDYLDQLHAAGWKSGDVGTIGDEAHLQAERPQDHTPFSVTGWPVANPYPYIHALDAMHHPDRGLDVGPLAAYWLDEARAGRTPWVKYINWRGVQYDTRRNWQPSPVDGHFDHAHVSFRTDWTYRSIGNFAVVKKGTPMSTTDVGRSVWKETISSEALGMTTDAGDWLKYGKSASDAAEHANEGIGRLERAVAALATLVGSPVNPGDLAEALAGSEAFVDALAAAIVAKSAPDTLEVRVKAAKELLAALGQAS